MIIEKIRGRMKMSAIFETKPCNDGNPIKDGERCVEMVALKIRC